MIIKSRCSPTDDGDRGNNLAGNLAKINFHSLTARVASVNDDDEEMNEDKFDESNDWRRRRR